MNLLRDAVVPVAAAYGLIGFAVVYGSRHPVPRPGSSGPLTRAALPSLLRCIAVTAAGGYAALMAVVFVFHFLIVGERDALASAAWGAAFLVAVATPAFVLLSWLDGRRSR